MLNYGAHILWPKICRKSVDGINFRCFTVDGIATNYWRRVVKNRNTK